ncbi:MAG TPA: hypothetical protein VFF27_15195 [Bacteroidia bacterium]|jgi:hypothetical protein|nr:hypothetical protein [Bacteroidia bacterium]
MINRIIVLEKFGFEYTDADQVMMWIGTSDFYKLEFYEPAYYGQDYNTMMEALLAAPFFKCVSPAYLLPIVSSILALLPYFIFAIVCYRKQLKVQALFILAMPLILPPEHDFITSMARGFVTGLFFSVLGSLYIYHQEKKWSFFFFSFLSITGLALNPNGILLTVPCGLFLLYENYKNKSFYIQATLGALLGAIYPLYISYFYRQYPNYLVHELWKLRFMVDNLMVGFSDLNNNFGGISPVFWYHSTVIILLFITIPVIFFIQKQRVWGFISIITIVFTMLTLGINKVYDGDGSVFLPCSRMYLAIPYVILLWTTFMRIEKWKLPVILTVGIACCSFIQKTITIDDAVEEAAIPPPHSLLTAYKVPVLNEMCERIKEQKNKFDVKLIIVARHWADKYISYGCTTCDTEIPLTLSPSNDRRTFRLIQEKDNVYSTILLIDENDLIEKEAGAPGKQPIKLVPLGNHLFLLQNNSLTVLQLIKRLKIELRTF